MLLLLTMAPLILKLIVLVGTPALLKCSSNRVHIACGTPFLSRPLTKTRVPATIADARDRTAPRSLWVRRLP